MNIKLKCQNHFNAYWDATVLVLRTRNTDRNWTRQPTWRHYSIGLVSPATRQNGRWYLWPLRFGVLHKDRRLHVYLGVVYLHFDTKAVGSLKDSNYRRAGPLSFIWQT